MDYVKLFTCVLATCALKKSQFLPFSPAAKHLVLGGDESFYISRATTVLPVGVTVAYMEQIKFLKL